MDTADTVRVIVSRFCKGRGIRDNEHLCYDLHLDQYDRTELFSAIEIRFHIDFSEEEVATYSTVAALIGLVETKIRAVGV